MNRYVERYSVRRTIGGISSPLYFPLLTYASVLKSQHAPVTLIAEALGHADIRTTQVYLDSFANSELDHFNDLL
ncbi:hypothetical protein P872_14505 [Rhodonellum psychrophilum GCM71 = DSM 17998]|uniref:Tyr recombinase domain-containing protein n=2 Tax=Rhodonellum TaxID=336827 RepID=U5BQG3_9BACT|nr:MULTISPECIES: hypothetical protein [Rhodonellum]ERM80143.1 hypothetical protein P872_14505 [Rhodonellum psychrophilum GCM71 = DSM 17998]SDZ57501.1 hypothetical protein SAMN05444412_12919 [Rhodonellum ikkaensis]